MNYFATTGELLPAEAKPRRQDETKFHRSVVEYLRWALPFDAFFYHCPMGGKRHSKAAAMLVPLGAKAGIPDLLVHHHGASVYLELKIPGTGPSGVQRQVHARLHSAGVTVGICRTLNEVALLLEMHGVPLKAWPT